MTTEDLAAAIAGRPDWRADGPAAVYAPGAGDWIGRVRAVERPERVDRSWHIAVVHDGAARHSAFGRSAADAVRWAERLVRTCLAPAPVSAAAAELTQD